MNQSEGKSCRLQASPGKPTPCSTSVDAPQPFIGGQSWLRARRHGVNIFLVGIRLQWGEQKGDRWGPLKEPLLFSSPSLQTSHQAPAVLPPSLSPRASPDWNPHPAFVSKPDCPHPGTALILPPPPHPPPPPKLGPESPVHRTFFFWVPQVSVCGEPARIQCGGSLWSPAQPHSPSGAQSWRWAR